MRQLIKNNTFLRRLYRRSQLIGARPQADESAILARLTEGCPRTFIEFGFHPTEFNCIDLARNPEWQGLLIDGDNQLVEDARTLWPSTRLEFVQAFLTLKNLDLIRKRFPLLGVLSIDVDGNDYWFLKALVDLSPSVISVEYNSTFGFEPITVPYDPEFDRNKKHARGWYHGASLVGLTRLCAQHGYGLAAVSDGSCNAFFTRDGTLRAENVWKPNTGREKRWGIPQQQQWEYVKGMPFVTV